MKDAIRTAGLWACNVVLFAALIDAAVAAALAASPVRLVVIVAVAIYGSLLVAFWREIDLAVKAELSLAALIALLAYDGWQLGTLSAPQGVTVFGFSADVAAAIVASALLIATLVAVLAARRAPLWLRIALAAVIAYPLFSIGAALLQGTGFSEALASDAPFPSGPPWLRGAFVAAAVVFPAAALGSLVFAAVLALRKQGVLAIRFGAAVLGFAAATQLSGLEASRAGLPAVLALGQGRTAPAGSGVSDAAAPQSLPSQTTLGASGPSIIPAALRMPSSADAQGDAGATLAAPAKQAAEQPQDAAAHMDQVAASLPKEAYDVDAETDKLGAGALPAFDYVRDHIRFESYSGMLRGSHVTFSAGAGNAWDRSVLLAHMLARKGIKLRFAAGRLPAPLADKLYDRMFEPPAPAGSASVPVSDAQDSDLRNRIYARARRDYAVLTAALGTTSSGASVPARAGVESEIVDHAWVEAFVNGAWVDLDTSFPDAKAGQAYASVDKTYSDVPPEAMQHVTVRAKAEFLANGTLGTTTALETTLPAWQLIDRQVFFSNQANGGLGGIFGNRDALTPTLWVAGDISAGKPIAFANTAAKTNPVGGAISAFSRDGSSSAAATSNGPVFVSEAIEFEIDKPDGSKDVTRRVLVDRAGPAWREASVHDPSALSDLPRNQDGLIAGQGLYNIWFSAGDHNLRGYADNVATLMHSVTPATSSASAPAMSFDDSVDPLALTDFALPVLSDHVIVPSLNDSAQIHFYADSPRIFMFDIEPDPSEPGAIFFETDLRRDALRGVVRDTSQTPAVLAHKLWFGVLEGALEHELGSANGAGAGSDPATEASTSNLLTPGGVTVFGPGSGSSVEAADKDTAAGLRAALASGDTLVVPKAVLQGGTAGWWQIDHATGDTHAVLGADINGYKVRVPTPGGGGDPPVWGNVNGKTVRIKSGGGEIGEYNATNDMMAFTAGEVKGLAAGVAALIGVAAALFELLK